MYIDDHSMTMISFVDWFGSNYEEGGCLSFSFFHFICLLVMLVSIVRTLLCPISAIFNIISHFAYQTPSSHAQKIRKKN